MYGGDSVQFEKARGEHLDFIAVSLPGQAQEKT